MPKVQVVSKPESFYRGGIKFTREPTVLDTAELSKEQLAAIRGESLLVVSDYAEPKAEKGGK